MSISQNGDHDSFVSPEDQGKMAKISMHRILPKLFLGGHRAAEKLDYLRINDISFVLSIRTGNLAYSVRRAYENNGIQHVRKKEQDIPGEDLLSIFRETCDLIEERLQKGKGVLVHCTMGISRSSTIMAAYVMQRWGISRDEALVFVREKRSVISPNRGFHQQLGTWGKELSDSRQAAYEDELITQPRGTSDQQSLTGSHRSDQTSAGTSRAEGSAVRIPAVESPSASPQAAQHLAVSE